MSLHETLCERFWNILSSYAIDHPMLSNFSHPDVRRVPDVGHFKSISLS